MFLRASIAEACWICGSRINLSREHKIKASDLRRQFGEGHLHVATFDDPPSEYRVAQSSGSKHLKFGSSICEKCNSSTTQEADRAYDQFMIQLERDDASAQELIRAFSHPIQPNGSQSQSVLPIFRYFGKMLGCQLANIGAPIPNQLSRFVANGTNRNCIWLAIRRDETYEYLSAQLSDEKLRYAAHGGLVVITKAPKLLPSRLYSTLTVGPIQFMFFFVLKRSHIVEMRVRFPGFVQKCRQSALRDMEDRVDSPSFRRLGLYRHDKDVG